MVATPIGNLEDISARALQALRDADLVAAEDTRGSRVLLERYGIGTPMQSLHEHNEAAQCGRLVERIRAGQRIALVSDAGTPLVSDPGFRLVAAVRAAGLAVHPLPGACAAIAALSVAGLASDRFVFEGFLPARAAARRERLQALAGETRTLIVYESSHRIVEALADACAVLGGGREAALARELTKRFETVIAAPLDQIHARVLADSDQQRGEFVLVVAGADGGDEAALLAEGRRVFALLREELPPARAARLAAAISGAPRKALYAG